MTGRLSGQIDRDFDVATPPDQANNRETPDRNQLALMRTRLANERTLLAYTRTAIMLAATGGTMVAIESASWRWLTVAYTLLSASVVVAGTGWARFHRLSRTLRGSGLGR